MSIYVMRHGETDWNKQGRLQGRQDIGINGNGVQQIRESFRKLRQARQIERIVSSPLQRAVDSARICAAMAGLPVQIDGRFAERHFGELEGLTLENIRMKYGIEDPESIDDDRFGIEPAEAMNRRVREAVSGLREHFGYAHVLVVTHGSVICALTGQRTIPRNGETIKL